MAYFLNSNMEFFLMIYVSRKLLKSKLKENWFFLPSPPSDEDIHKMTGFVHRRHKPVRDRDRGREQHVSWWAVCLKLLVFDLVPDFSEYRKQSRLTIIRCCEKKPKKFNVISTCEVVPMIEESKHNRYLRLPCAWLWTVRIEKPQIYTRN